MSQRSSSSPVLPPSSQFSGNRNIVVVDQEIFNDSISSLENLDESFTISESSSGTRQLHGASQVTESSVSFQDKSSENCTYLCNCLDELQIPSHLEDLVDRLGSEIEQASIGYERILGDLKEIPSLKEKIGSLTKENKILEQEVEKKAAMIESLNERMSLLQEQNVQLAQLSRTSGDQSATLSMRNSLVASLTQLKKLQAQVDEIPELKNKISNLTEDVKRKETTELHSTTSSEALEVYPKKLKEQISHLSQLIENLSTRMEEYEKSHSLENVALASFKKLEELLAKLLESKSIMPFDSSNKAEVVDNNCISLLSKEMLRREVEFSKQKDLIISKLFDIQYSGLQVAKSEVMQSLSGTSSMENEFVKSQSFKKKTDGAVSAVNILPLFQSQLSKLHHIRLIYRHSKNTWAAIMPCCKESAGVGSNNEKYLVQELKHLAAISEENIRKTQPNILEGSTSINPILQCDETCSAMEEELTKERRMHKSYFKKYKKEKEKRKSFEEKHREVCAKYQAIATELTQSAALLQKYQFQCEELEVERNKIQSDHHKLMEDYGNLQAQHSDFFFKSVNYISIPNYFSNITGTMSSVKAAELENSLIERLCLSVHTLEESVPSKFKQSGLGNIITKIDSAMKELVSTHEVVLEKLKNEVSEHQRSTLKKEVVQLASEKCSLEQELACLNSKHQDIILDLQNQLESFQTGLKMCQAEKDTLQMKLKEVAALVNEVNGNLEARKVVCAELEKENDNLRQKLHEKERQIVPNSSLFEKEHQYGGRIEMDTLDASLRESLELKITILESELENYRKSSIHKSQSTQTPHVSVMLNVLSKSTQTDLLHSDEKGMSVMGISKSTQTDLLYGDDKGMSVMRISKSTQTDMLHSNEKGLSVMRISTSTQTDSLQSDEKGKHSVPLNEYNLQLENQVSVLSQWNDKQRAEIEELERQVQDMYKEYDRLLIDFKNQEDLAQQNANLQQELLEVEDEMKMLRKVSNLEIQEELQMKLDAQIFVVTTLNEKNKDLHKQVHELLEMRHLTEADFKASRQSFCVIGGNKYYHSFEDLAREHVEYRNHIAWLETKFFHMFSISPCLQRFLLPVLLRLSVPVSCCHSELLERIPDDFLQSCSLLHKHMCSSTSCNESALSKAKLIVSSLWFYTMSQKTLTLAHANKYIAAISNISSKLMDVFVNLQDDQGNTALHYFAASGNFTLLELFLNIRSCNPCISNKKGYCPAMIFCSAQECYSNYSRVQEALLSKTDKESCTKSGVTLLMVAAACGNVSMASILEKCTMDINSQDKYGNTALMYASYNGQNGVIQLLIDNPVCNVHLKDNTEYTAIDVARDAGHKDITILLTKKTSIC